MLAEIAAAAVKELREKTGAGVMECRRALEEAGGNLEKATEILRRQGLVGIQKRAERATSQGTVDTYIHAGGRIGALVEVNCETDFVARHEEFRQLAHDIAMQVAATSPRYLSAEDVPPDTEENPKEVALLAQPFIKDPGRTIQDLVNEVAVKFKENVRVRRFARFELGAE
ncbi:MAG: elongation factor Ts [Chloroflexi bacterium]|nr:elongation factor Ts [Chloroflexota bacterium]